MHATLAVTGLSVPVDLNFDSSHNIYVANRNGNSVTVYAPNANGNVAPIRTITGSNTQLSAPSGLALL